MTRERKVLLVGGLALLLAWTTGAQDEGVKVGIVDLSQAINATEEGKAAREELNRKQRELLEQFAASLDEDNLREDEGMLAKLKRALAG